MVDFEKASTITVAKVESSFITKATCSSSLDSSSFVVEVESSQSGVGNSIFSEAVHS